MACARLRWFLVTVCMASAACGQAPAGQATGTADAGLESDTATAGTDATAPIDTVDVAGPDTDQPDVPVAQDATAAADSGAACPGGPRCPCTTPDDCDNALCVADQDGSYCAAPCAGGCLATEACIQTTQGSDLISLCAPRFASLCAPCLTDTDCRQDVIAGKPVCHAAGSSGSFCAATCDGSHPCPDNFACTAGLCLPQSGACTCSAWAVQHAAATSCTVTSPAGTCAATLQCTTTGPLSACPAATPTAETCNGADDDCDGATDEGVACDDGDACTADACLAAQCLHTAKAVCGDGACSEPCGESPASCPADCTPVTDPCAGKECDDGNPCTQDGCSDLGECTHTASAAKCSDGNACTAGDHCVSGACQPGAVLVCDDGNACTADACDQVTGCTAIQADGLACSDGNPCTLGDTCLAGSCVPGGNPDCDDANPCTKDACAAGSCLHLPVSHTCTDGDACTLGDACSGGSCMGAAALDCDDANTCTTDACDAVTGCVHGLADGVPCSDGDACTPGDVCLSGSCTNGAPLACDDQNACTDDGCSAGLCVHLANTATCTNPDACAVDAHCALGSCAGAKTVSCDDGNACTTDTCDPLTGCTTLPADGAACSDGDPCTAGDNCSGGQCLPGPAPDCSDGNPCTDDTCAGGCQHGPNAAGCTDGNACTTGDACADGACKPGSAVTCSDNNPCTADSCDPVAGCSYLFANGTGCDDGDACTVSDVCVGGACKGGGPLPCDDGNPCTTDSCASGACQAVPNSALCDDKDACTTGDHCAGGSCTGALPKVCTDGNPCTADTCDSASGCLFLNDNFATCSDGNACTLQDACQDGLCTGPPKDCNDNDPCTDDACSGGNCTHVHNTAPCEDGNPCTLTDTCAQGVCAGTANPCADAIACTVDACDPLTGACQHTPGPASGCADSQPCTDDACDVQLGCVHLANTATCTDGNACTTSDLCKNGACVGGAAPTCDDGNACTTDSCAPASGCTFTNNTAACSDGDPCTTGDTCKDGTCQPTTASDCAPGVLAYQRLTNTVALDDLRRVCWHPSGSFALILAGSGKVLRYTVAGQALTLETTLGKGVTDLDVQPDGSYFLVLGTNASSVAQVWKGAVGTGSAITWTADVTLTGTPVAIASEPGGASFGIGTYTGSPYITTLRRWQNGAITLTQAVSTSAGLWDIMWTGPNVLPAIGGSDVLMTSQGVNGGGSQSWIIDTNTITSNGWSGGFGNGGGAGWRPGGTFGIVAGWSSNIVYVYDGAWKSTYLPGIPNGYQPVAIGWKPDGKRALATGHSPWTTPPTALVFEYRAGSAAGYDATQWIDQRIPDWDKTPWFATNTSTTQLYDVAWRPGTTCDEGLIVASDLGLSYAPTYGVLIRFYDLNDGACTP